MTQPLKIASDRAIGNEQMIRLRAARDEAAIREINAVLRSMVEKAKADHHEIDWTTIAVTASDDNQWQAVRFHGEALAYDKRTPEQIALEMMIVNERMRQWRG